MTEFTEEVERIKVVKCLSSKVVEKDENCAECRDRGCCLTINPELANLVDKCEKSEGIYEFTQEDGSLIRAKYKRALEFNNIEMHPGIMGMRDFMIEMYYNTETMPLVISEDIVNKLEYEEYTDEEIELLYAVVTDKYDEMLGM